MDRVCSEADIHNDSTICISAALTQDFQEFPDVDILRDMVIPALLQTVIKGFNSDYCIFHFIFLFYVHIHSCQNGRPKLLEESI